MPQAAIWAAGRQHRQVAMHVRTSVEAEEHGATTSLRSLLLRQENALLLNESALLRAGYRISSRPSGPVVKPNSAGEVVDIRERWRAMGIPDARTRLRPKAGDDG